MGTQVSYKKKSVITPHKGQIRAVEYKKLIWFIELSSLTWLMAWSWWLNWQTDWKIWKTSQNHRYVHCSSSSASCFAKFLGMPCIPITASKNRRSPFKDIYSVFAYCLFLLAFYSFVFPFSVCLCVLIFVFVCPLLQLAHHGWDPAFC